MAWKTEWAVTIDGTDVSTAMRPYLLSLEVSDRPGMASDACNLSFDDSGGRLLLPRAGRSIVVSLDGQGVFRGVVDSSRWSLSRGGGRVLAVNGKGFDTRGRAKERTLWHLDDATLGDALRKGGEKAGLAVVVDPELAAIRRDYWACENQHFMEWAQGLANQLGATFKIRQDRAVFAKRGAGRSATGAAMPTITGRAGHNLISADIVPSWGRPLFARSKVRYFDRASAEFREREVEIDTRGASTDVTDARLEPAANADDADELAGGRKARREREVGSGTVEIDLAPEAQAEGTFVLVGARPGIDGSYRITGVTHRCTRSDGSTTSLELGQPLGDVGKDDRVPVPTPRPST